MSYHILPIVMTSTGLGDHGIGYMTLTYAGNAGFHRWGTVAIFGS